MLFKDIKIISVKLDPKFTSALAFDFGYITKPPLNLDFTSIQVYLYRRGWIEMSV